VIRNHVLFTYPRFEKAMTGAQRSPSMRSEYRMPVRVSSVRSVSYRTENCV
jgi:hypothetical protein